MYIMHPYIYAMCLLVNCAPPPWNLELNEEGLMQLHRFHSHCTPLTAGLFHTNDTLIILAPSLGQPATGQLACRRPGKLGVVGEEACDGA